VVCNFEVPSVVGHMFWIVVDLLDCTENVWVVKSKRVGPKVRQSMGSIEKEVEEFENFKLIGKLIFYVK
jgi:hypothetical protein